LAQEWKICSVGMATVRLRSSAMATALLMWCAVYFRITFGVVPEADAPLSDPTRDDGPWRTPRYAVPTLSFNELGTFEDGSLSRLAWALRDGGGLVALLGVPGFAEAEAVALSATSSCLRSSAAEGHAAEARFEDGSVRKTFAAVTQGMGVDGSFPDWVEKSCAGVAEATDSLRMASRLAVEALADSCDRLPGIYGPLLRPVIAAGEHLEHFHRYETAGSSGAGGGRMHSKATLDLHTDAGLLLAMTRPSIFFGGASGSVMQPTSMEPVLEVELPGGRIVAIDVPHGAILLLVGQGLADYFPGHKLRAVPHALHLSRARDRTAGRMWYGRMVLPPRDFVLGRGITYGEWLDRASNAVSAPLQTVNGGSSHIVGCLSQAQLERRLSDLAGSCASGEIFCWLQCTSVAELPCGNAAKCIDGGSGAICKTHGAQCKPQCPKETGGLIVSGAGIKRVNGKYSEFPTDSGRARYQQLQGSASIYWNGNAHEWAVNDREYRNGTVLYWSDDDADHPWDATWYATSGREKPPPTMESSLDSHVAPGHGFCNGMITDMHMSGFISLFDEDKRNFPCLVVFLSSWKIDRYTKFALAWCGAVVAGIACEAMLAVRRPKEKLWATRHRWLATALEGGLYAGHRTLGYLAMLLAMTYSVEIFVAVILGLTIGYLLFNLSASTGEGETPCCNAMLSESPRTGMSSQSLGGPIIGDGRSFGADRVHLIVVNGMTCNACSQTIKKRVLELPLVSSVTVDLQKRLCCVAFIDGSVHDVAEVLAAINELGYDASVQEDPI